MKPIDTDEFMRKRYFNERNNTDEQYEDASYNASETKKQSDVSAKVFTAQGRVDIHNQHFVIPMITNARKRFHGRLYMN